MIAVTKLFMSLIKMTVLAHYLMFSIQLQWLMKEYLITSFNIYSHNTYYKQKDRGLLQGSGLGSLENNLF